MPLPTRDDYPPLDESQRAEVEACHPLAVRAARDFARRFPQFWDELEEEANYQVVILIHSWDRQKCPSYAEHVGHAIRRRLVDAVRRWGAAPAWNGTYSGVGRRVPFDLDVYQLPGRDGAALADPPSEMVARVKRRLSPDQRDFLDAYIESDLSTAKAAERLGVSQRTAVRRAKEIMEAAGSV